MKRLFNSIKSLKLGLIYLLVFYCYLAAVHLTISFLYLNADTWYNRVSDNSITQLFYFVGVPITCATLLLIGKIKHNIKLLKIGLAGVWIYHLAISILNLIYFAGAGTPWIPALFVGSVSLLLYLHYSVLD